MEQIQSISEIKNPDVNEILMECARLRGCYPLVRRTLSEFNWFISTRWHNNCELGEDEMTKCAEAFLKYCQEQYGNDQH